jgi:hypothetical protein
MIIRNIYYSIILYMATEFIQFGCWNNLNLKDETTEKGCLRSNMNNLKEYVTHPDNKDKIHSIIVSGDNYYPDKTKQGDTKQKIINKQKLTEGFSLLPKTVPITMILGNHDLETNQSSNPKKNPYFVKNTNTNTGVSEEVNSCVILNSQFDSVKTASPNLDYCFFKSVTLNNHTLVLMLDTSIYDTESNEYLTCYRKFFKTKELNGITASGMNGDNKENVSIDDIKQYQQRLIDESLQNLSPSIVNIVIVGHHPILQLKKKGETNTKTDILEFKPVLLSIYKQIKQTPRDKPMNYYYLCSDLHLYQTGIITINIDKEENTNTTENETMIIKQYISGIGGTELDKPTKETTPYKSQTLLNGMSYEMTYEKAECGFLICNYSDPSLLKFTPSFIDEQQTTASTNNRGASASISGGRKKSRKMKRNKTKKLKTHRRTKSKRRIIKRKN